MAKQDKLDISSILIKEEHVRLMDDIVGLQENLEFHKTTLAENKKALAEKLGVKAKVANEILKRYMAEGQTGDAVQLNEIINSAVEQAMTIRDSMKK